VDRAIAAEAGNGIPSVESFEAAGRITDTMSGSDALLWTISTDPVMRPTIVAVMILAGTPAWGEVRTRVKALTEALPRLRSRAMSRGPGRIRPQFVVDPAFDLDLHLRRMRVAGVGDRRSVLDVAQAMATSGFDHALPLWEAVLIEGLDGGEAALVMKVHHALIDGVGGLASLGALFDTPDGGRPGATTAPSAGGGGDGGGGRGRSSTLHPDDLPEAVKLVDQALDAVRHPFRALGRVATVGTSVARLMAPAGRPVSPIMQGRSFRRHVEVVDVALTDLRRAARGWQATLNDVFVASVVRGLARYHEQHGVASTGFRALMPVNVRHPGDPAAGNHFVPARFVIPVHAELAECVAEVRRLTGTWKQAPGLALSEVMATALSTLPAPTARALWGSMLMGNDFCITNVPGPPFPVSIDGAAVRAIYAVSPPSGAAFNVSLVSTWDRACVALTVDSVAVPDSAKLAGCIDDGFAEVCSVRAD
jgi:WS/DGAT/MGAT family acyltransferase